MMQYRQLGKWGIRVSEISLGSWLTYGNSVEERNAVEQIHFAFDHGINFFDTANVYAAGRSEEVVGKAIGQLPREKVVVATKVYFPMGDGPNDKGLSRKHVMEQCHASLRRLRTDYVDLYQCHRHDPDTPLEELVTTMDILTRQGKILYWGISEWTAEQIQQACDVARQLNAPPPVSNQPCYNMLVRNIEREVIPASERNGIGQVVFSPLAQGVLTGKYRAGEAIPENSRAASEKEGVFMRGRGLLEKPVLEVVGRLLQVATELELTLSQLALSWCLRIPSLSSVIIGATRKEQIEENIKASGIILPGEAIASIDNILSATPATR